MNDNCLAQFILSYRSKHFANKITSMKVGDVENLLFNKTVIGVVVSLKK